MGGYGVNLALQSLIKIIANSAVPMFFVMSGYLLFYKYDIRRYLDTLNKKVRTLLIPFVLWNLLGFAYHKCLSLLSIVTGVAEANPELLSARNILYGVWKSAYDPPVWFIKTLFELILISPLVWGIANKLKQKTVVLVIFIALSVIGFTPGYTSILFWIPLYLLAATIACCKNDMISHFSMTRSYLCVVLYCSFIAYLLLNNVDEKASAYGKEGFKAVHEYLMNGGKSCMAGFVLKNTLSDHGGVTRGVCKMDEEHNLTEVMETKNIVKTADGAEADGKVIDVNSLVSMNMWGLTPDFLDVLEKGFKEFFEKEVPENPLKSEYLIPIYIGELLKKGEMSVKVLKTNDTWYGMTYHEDVAAVKDSFKKMLENGVYKADLFSDL